VKRRHVTRSTRHTILDPSRVIPVVGAVKAKVTRNGQVTLPEPLRRRWSATSVLVIDRGDYAIVRPVPDDVVAALRGSLAGPGPTADAMRRSERDAEAGGARGNGGS
jgi:bifunctional DNA-binding transcriptional regulator/antitoxin component of YhaV-PrlF toxin-antitoxin module